MKILVTEEIGLNRYIGNIYLRWCDAIQNCRKDIALRKLTSKANTRLIPKFKCIQNKLLDTENNTN